jgi:hypothetical protein
MAGGVRSRHHERDEPGVRREQQPTLEARHRPLGQGQQGQDAGEGGTDGVPAHPRADRQRPDQGREAERGGQHRHVGPDRVPDREARPPLRRGEHRGDQLLGLGAGEQHGDGEHRQAQTARGAGEVVDEQLRARDEQDRRQQQQRGADHGRRVTR